MNTHKDLIVWKKSIDLVKIIYKMTETFPSSEQFGLVAQIRRSAVSIPSNIAEGCGRNSEKELTQFLYLAIGFCFGIRDTSDYFGRIKLFTERYRRQCINDD